MSEIVQMSSGPQGTAASDEAFSEPSSQEFGQEESNASTSTESTFEENVPRGINGNGEDDDGRPKSAEQRKQLSKYERTKRQRAEFNKRQELFRQEQEKHAQERARFAEERAQFEESKKPKRDYSLADLKKYRQEWAREAEEGIIPGRAELVQKADNEIAAMEAEERASKTVVELPKRGTKEHTQIWHAAEADLARSDPEFMKPGSRLDTKLREIFAGPNASAYADHAQGIYAAYNEARKLILEEDVRSLQTENAKLKKELQRYGGLTSISGGVPGRIGDGGITSTADFARLSTSDMRRHLLAGSKRNKDTTGWL
jgi:hypothetical protein